jgi:methyl-accepting chemotaxis protein
MKLFFDKSASAEAERAIAAVATSATAIMIADQDYVIRFMNPAVKDLLTQAEADLKKVFPDFSVDNLIGTSIDRFHKNPSHQHGLLGALKARHRATIKVGAFTFDLSASPLVDRKGRPIGVAVEWADASIRLANIQFKAVADALDRSQAVIEFEPGGTIINANDNFLGAMGYSLDEIRGKPHRMFVAPEEAADASYAKFWDDLRQGQFYAREFKRIGKNGKEVWIQASYNPILDENGKVFKVVKYASDVTAAKLESANMLGQIQAIHKSQAVIEFDLNGAILNANENFLKVTGYTLAEIKGKHHSMFVAADERGGAAYREFWQALARGEYRAEQFRRIRKSGDEFFIQASYNPILDLNGRPWKVVKFAHDITQEHQAKLRTERERGELISAVAAGSEELNASVREIAEAMIKSRQTADQAAASVDQADAISQKFDENAKSTANIVEMIGSITDQINLLALNATIESARAGEAGRGFAVVASEVKSLAGQVKGASEKISAEISAMQTSSKDVVSSLLQVKREIDAVQQYVSSTAAAVEQQSAVAGELSATVQRAVAHQ